MVAACSSHYKLYRTSWSKVRVRNTLAAVRCGWSSAPWKVREAKQHDWRKIALCWGSHRSDLIWSGVFLVWVCSAGAHWWGSGWCCVYTAVLCFPVWHRHGMASQTMTPKQTPPVCPEPPQHLTLRDVSGVFVTYRGEQCSGRGLLCSSFSFISAMQVLWGALWITWGWIFLGYNRYQAS